MEKRKFAVIGVGMWGESHIRVFKDHPFAEMTAISDKNEKRLGEIAEKCGIPRKYADYRALLDSDIDAVSIATPDFAHEEIALAAIKAGKHVLIEKPMATTKAGCDRILTALKKNPVKFMVDFHNRWSPPFYKAKKAVDDGELGNIQFAHYRLWDTIFVPTQMLSWTGKSTVNWFLATHSLDTMMWLLGDEPARVTSLKRDNVLTPMGIPTADFYASLIEFRKGTVCALENGWILPNTWPNIIDLKCRLVGDKGALCIDGSNNRAIEKYTSSGGSYPDVLVMPGVHGRPTGFAYDSIRYFADCVIEDRQPMCTAADGAKVTEIILAIQKSADTGRTVEL
ncbi:MAG TPA: Gfo/Idh/MocA family oxidoreductase [Candidatus Brocadiia bacterium]|nr:Gfo/Idh/MocA family oxidoreductase [Candidatus Brocadiia bacterium]